MKGSNNRDVFSRNLVRYMERSGKTQREVSEYMGVASSTFNEWMKGKKYPRMDKVELLANYFGCKKSDLIEEKKTTEDDGLSHEMMELISRIKALPEDKVQLLLQLAKSIE